MSDQQTGAQDNGSGENAGAQDNGEQSQSGEQQSQQQSGEQTGDNGETGGEQDSRVTRANREAANYRVERNEARQQAEAAEQRVNDMLANIGKALGLEGAGEADPAEQVSTLTGQVESLSSENKNLRAELRVHSIAADAGGDANALLDSRAFTDVLHGLDPAADDYDQQVEAAIKSAADKSPALRAAGQGSSTGGAEQAGQGSGSGAAVTAEQFKSMSYREQTELFNTNPALYRELNGTAT